MDGLGVPNPVSGPLGGSQAPGDPAGSSCQSDNPGAAAAPSSAPNALGCRPGQRNRAEWGRGVAPVAPALSDVIGQSLRGPRHLFSIPPRPPGCACLWAGPARAVDVTAKFAALGTPRVAAATAWEAAGERLRAQWPRPLTGPAQPDSATRLPGGAREHFGAAGSSPRGVDCSARAFWLPLVQRDSRGLRTRAERARPGGPGEQGSRGWEARSLAAIWRARSSAVPERRVPSPGRSEGCTVTEQRLVTRGLSGRR